MKGLFPRVHLLHPLLCSDNLTIGLLEVKPIYLLEFFKLFSIYTKYIFRIQCLFFDPCPPEADQPLAEATPDCIIF